MLFIVHKYFFNPSEIPYVKVNKLLPTVRLYLKRKKRKLKQEIQEFIKSRNKNLNNEKSENKTIKISHVRCT